MAKVIPVYETGEKIHLTTTGYCFNSKKFEKNSLITDWKNSWNKTLSDSQCGFWKNRSTSLALLEMTEEITNAIDNKKASIGVFIDLKKLLIVSIIIYYYTNLK